MIYGAQKNRDKQLLPTITEGFSLFEFGAYGKDWDAGCWAKWTKERIWNVSKVRVTVLNRAQWSSGHMQGWCSVGAWVQQNVWILHKPKEGGKKLWYLKTRIPKFFSVSPDENGFGSAACLGLCVSASVCDNCEVCKCGCVWISECLGMAAGKQAESRRFEPYMLPDPLSRWWLQRNCHLTSQRL